MAENSNVLVDILTQKMQNMLILVDIFSQSISGCIRPH